MKTQKPFTGQMMTCVVCGTGMRSHPEAETNWRCLEVDDNIFYACPKEFPPDGSNKKKYVAAYQAVMACCLSEGLVRAGKAPVAEVEEYRASRKSQVEGKLPQPKGFR